ncbi:MAG: ATP-dependent zinc metalloprotease FtsH, partial [Arenicellales bacterium]
MRSGQVAEITMRGQQVSGRLKAKQGNGAGSSPAAGSNQGGPLSKSTAHRFTTTIPSVGDPKLMPLLESQGVVVNARSTRAAWWQRLLIDLLPWVLLGGLIFYFSRQMQQRMASGGGIFNFGRSRARRFRAERPEVDMSDIAGSENAKSELEEIADFLGAPDRYRSVGADIPRGVLMVGPPGTGKTLMAKAVAAEAGVPFFSIGGSEFIEMFVGVGASRVRDMFGEAKSEAPSIIFIDELDSIGRARGAGLGGGHDEREQTLNQILSEMDGFDERESVIVLAATNRPDVLDPALMRPGRFDRQVTFERPHKDARAAILGLHTRDKPLAADVDLALVAGRTVGFSGADLANLVNEAALLTARDQRDRIAMHDFAQARDKLVLGARREEVLGEEEQRVIAYHESGHALMAAKLPNADPLDKVTIIPRGRALGATEQVAEDRYNMNQSYLMDRLGVMLGGRGAEKLVFDQVSTGAEQDLKQATRLARKMVLNWGMSGKLGPVAFRDGEEQPFLGREMSHPREYSEATAKLIDDEVRSIVISTEERVDETLRSNRRSLEALA